MGTLALIGLGSNLGDRRAHLDEAVAAMARAPGIDVRAVSSYLVTDPVGGPAGQGAYLNAAAEIQTTLEPIELLERLQDIERQAGRVRTQRWGERPLDLDILIFGDRVIETPPSPGGEAPGLIVPHPRMAVRRFVLAPLAEIAPLALDPLTGRSMVSLLANVDRRPSYLALHECAPKVVDRVTQELSAVVPRPGHGDARLAELRDRWLISDLRHGVDGFVPFAPTFVVARPGARPSRLELDNVPVLKTDSRDPDAAAAEILAACAASRAGR